MTNQVTGKLFKVLEQQTGTGSKGNWVKQEFVIETLDQYPKKIHLSLWGDKVEVLNNCKPGNDIKVHFNLESREYNERWYTEVKAWKIEALSGNVSASNGSNGVMNTTNNPEDLPF